MELHQFFELHHKSKIHKKINKILRNK
jgi:hypothetical protein